MRESQQLLLAQASILQVFSGMQQMPQVLRNLLKLMLVEKELDNIEEFIED